MGCGSAGRPSGGRACGLCLVWRGAGGGALGGRRGGCWFGGGF